MRALLTLTSNSLHDPGRLLPPPRSLQALERPWRPPTTIGIRVSGIFGRLISNDSPGLVWVDRALREFGGRLSFRSGLQAGLVLREESAIAPQGYKMRVTANGVVIGAKDAEGLQNGLATLAQWILLAKEAPDATQIPGVEIEDHPTFLERGVMIDVARDKRPSLPVLKTLIETLAQWKINRLQLYMEADFAYSGAETVWADRSPYTAKEIRDLTAFAADRHIQLVPNQQSFGHLHHWLRHEPWKHLAEVPEGVDHPFSRNKEPFSLNVTDPQSLEFLAELYDQLLPNFRGDQFNVGLDETFDLGLGKSRAACEERGKAKVYSGFLCSVHGLLAERGKHMQFWGDIALESPEMLADLPDDATAMVWGYESKHPYEEQLAKMAKTGLPFQVCPGTSSWNSFGGRTKNAFGNLRKAAQSALKHGAQGLLICDWGDRGHLQPWPISFFGWTLGAACAWAPEQAMGFEMKDVHQWLDRWAFQDPSQEFGRALLMLGENQETLQDPCENGTALFFNLVLPDDGLPSERVAQLEKERLEQVEGQLQDALSRLPHANSQHPEEQLLRDEMSFARDTLLVSTELMRARWALGPGISWRRLPGDQLALFRKKCRGLQEQHAELWNQRYRPGGLEHSSRWLQALASDE